MLMSITEHPGYASLLRALDKTVVRDKLLRLIQYFCRFLGFYLYRKGYSAESVASVKNIMVTLGTARKLFRGLNFLGSWKALLRELHNQTSDTFIHLTNITKHTGMAGFLFFDLFTYLHGTKIKNFGAAGGAKLTRLSFQFWLLGIVSGALQGAYLYARAESQLKALADEKNEDASLYKKAEIEKANAASMLFMNVLDSTIPGSGLGVIKANDGIVGIAGVITSWMGLKAVW